MIVLKLADDFCRQMLNCKTEDGFGMNEAKLLSKLKNKLSIQVICMQMIIVIDL